MSDAGQQKTEEASPRQHRKARERGQVAQSRDLTSTVVLAAVVGVLVWRHDEHAAALRRAFAAAIEAATAPIHDTGAAIGTAAAIVQSTALAFLPLLVLAALVGAGASFLQVGPLVTGETLKPKLERLDPLQGLKRMFASVRAWVDLLRSLLKLVVIAAVSWRTLSSRLPELLSLHRRPVADAVTVVTDVGIALVLRVAAAYVVLAILDLLYQRWQHGRDLRMTKDDVKREAKEQDGSPEQKAERKRAHQEVLAQADLARVRREADVVVVNPTHFACALGYDPDDGAPRLIAKGQDRMARRIRAVAEEAGIPVRHDVSLARALWELEVDDAVPPELYEAVAVTLDWVRMVLVQRGERPAWERGGGPHEPDATPPGFTG